MRLMPRKFNVSPLLVLLIFLGYSQGGATGTKTLTIRGSDADPGDTIEMSDTATVTVATGADGIVVTLPDVDVRMRCLGKVTEDGHLPSLYPGNAYGHPHRARLQQCHPPPLRQSLWQCQTSL